MAEKPQGWMTEGMVVKKSGSMTFMKWVVILALLPMACTTLFFGASCLTCVGLTGIGAISESGKQKEQTEKVEKTKPSPQKAPQPKPRKG